jgi:hypothetical protein
MSEPIQPTEPHAPQPRPAQSGPWVAFLKLALLVGAVLLLHHVVLPRLGLLT